MKLTKLVTTSAIVLATLVGSSSAALAAEYKSNGAVEFIENTDPTDPVDPKNKNFENNLIDYAKLITTSGADFLHCDIMDGKLLLYFSLICSTGTRIRPKYQSLAPLAKEFTLKSLCTRPW